MNSDKGFYKLYQRSHYVENGCFEWNGYRNAGGYGFLMNDKEYWLAHRLHYFCVYPNEDR